MGLQRVGQDRASELKSSKEAGVEHKVRSEQWGQRKWGVKETLKELVDHSD